jgi:hypothetical protein
MHQLWTGYQNITRGQNTSRNHALVNDRANTKGDIDTVLNQIYPTLGGVDVNLNVGVAALESR